MVKREILKQRDEYLETVKKHNDEDLYKNRIKYKAKKWKFDVFNN